MKLIEKYRNLKEWVSLLAVIISVLALVITYLDAEQWEVEEKKHYEVEVNDQKPFDPHQAKSTGFLSVVSMGKDGFYPGVVYMAEEKSRLHPKERPRASFSIIVGRFGCRESVIVPVPKDWYWVVEINTERPCKSPNNKGNPSDTVHVKWFSVSRPPISEFLLSSLGL